MNNQIGTVESTIYKSDDKRVIITYNTIKLDVTNFAINYYTIII